MVGSGVLFYRLGKRSQSDFFLAGRGLPWWLPASSVYATHTATDTPIWVTGVIYRYGLAGIWYTFFSAWCAISAFVSTRIFRRSLAYTQAEWNTLRFGGLGAELLRGWIAGWQVFMNMFILGWVGIAMGKVCNLAFGWDLWVGLVAFSSVCAIYALSSGYWGVVMADFQQGIIALSVILLVSLWGVIAAGGPGAIVTKLADMGESWRLDPFAFTGWFSGDFPVAWFITMLVIAVIGGFGMGTSIDGTLRHSGFSQRGLSVMPATASGGVRHWFSSETPFGRWLFLDSMYSSRASRIKRSMSLGGFGSVSTTCRQAWWASFSLPSWPYICRRFRRT